eukprot:91589-Prorocentrum_minimum.AAC.1
MPRCCFCRYSRASPFSLLALPSVARITDRELNHMAKLENWSWRNWSWRRWSAMRSISAAAV